MKNFDYKMANSDIHSFEFNTVIILLVVISDFSLCLRNVSVTIPSAVKRGDNAILICNYDIENDTLYSVKWYRGRREFYRYTPKEKPAWKIFSTMYSGINVNTTQSNASHVFLMKPAVTASGRYACEVSADAPSFHTLISFGDMDVVEIPAQRPIITGIHSRYRLGDIINGNCSSDYSKPAANLTWWINDIQVPPNYLRPYDIIKHENEQLETAVLEINFIVTLQHFIKGRLKLKCSARIYRIYYGDTEKLLEEDKPRILASGRSPQMYPFDQHNDEFDRDDDDDDDDDDNSLYLNRYNEYTSSSISGSLSITDQQSCMLWSIFVISLILKGYWHLMNILKYSNKQRNLIQKVMELKEFNEQISNINCNSIKQETTKVHCQLQHHIKQGNIELNICGALMYATEINIIFKNGIR